MMVDSFLRNKFFKSEKITQDNIPIAKLPNQLKGTIHSFLQKHWYVTAWTPYPAEVLFNYYKTTVTCVGHNTAIAHMFICATIPLANTIQEQLKPVQFNCSLMLPHIVFQYIFALYTWRRWCLKKLNTVFPDLHSRHLWNNQESPSSTL